MLSIQENAGTIDRSIRFTVGVILITVGILSAYSMGWKAVILVIGTAELITAATGY